MSNFERVDRERISPSLYTRGDREKETGRYGVVRHVKKGHEFGNRVPLEVHEVSGSQGAVVPED